jgi:hypothetical protein
MQPGAGAHIPGLIRGHPLEVVFLLGMTLGLRMGEATGVLWQDFGADNHVLYLRHQVAPDVQEDGGVAHVRDIVGEPRL